MSFESENAYAFLGPDMETVAEIVKDRLYFVTFTKANFAKVPNHSPPHYFNTDDQLVYKNFYNDFGPLHLGNLFRYWLIMNEKMKDPSLHGKRIVHWTTLDYRKRANSAFLMGAYAVVQLKMTPREVYRQLISIKQPYVPFHDASAGPSQFKIRLIDCLNALNKACYYGLVRIDDFDLTSYEYYERVENGDLNWVVPDKLIAVSGPMPTSELGCTPEYYSEYFRRYNVNDVVRCNKPNYLSSRFSDYGIKVHDMFFSDGSVPAKAIVYRFLSMVEDTEGAVAVHCKAGLGRTGCLIGAYLVKHYKMTALEAIAWMRICRPGCVIGHQQAWLEQCEKYLHRSGELYRLRNYGDINRIPLHPHGIYSLKNSQDLLSPQRRSKGTPSEAIGQSERKRSLVGSVGAGVGRLVAGLRKSTGAITTVSNPDWQPQAEGLRSRKWEYQGKKDKKSSVIKKRASKEATLVS